MRSRDAERFKADGGARKTGRLLEYQDWDEAMSIIDELGEA
jgi:hypothetical protein